MLDRRKFIKGLGAAACAVNVRTYAAVSSHRPNILIIITDEQSANAASYRIGTEYIHTPNMDSVASGGRIYTRAYCANPLCVPSRTSMFTGRYPTVTGIMDNAQVKTCRIDPHIFPLLGNVFRDGGYETAYFGKWHIAFPVQDTAINGFSMVQNIFPVQRYLERDTAFHGFSTVKPVMLDTETASSTAKFLQQKHHAPFFAVASFLNPHNITQWARGQALPLGSIGQPPPPDQCPPLRADHAPQRNAPDIMELMRRSYQAAPMFPVGHFSDAKWRQYQWAYYRLIEKVDAQIGIVLQALRRSGHEKDTLVVMLSDHGDCQGAHGWNQKTVFYEESTRVQFVLSHPGVIKPGTALRLVNTGIDLMPTLCDYAGITQPSRLHGLSVRDGETDPRRYVVVSNKMVQGVPVDGRRPTPTGRMLRAQRYKYCAYNEGKRRESLVDLQTDPGEMVNLAGDSHYTVILNEHRAMLKEWCSETQDSFPVPANT